MSDKRAFSRRELLSGAFLQQLREAREAEDPVPPRRSRSPAARPALRPPGAGAAAGFAERCDGCGACVEACPRAAIEIDPEGGLAHVRPAESPCVLCDALPCIAACPTGALQPVPREAVAMGTARIVTGRCHAWRGFDYNCDYCHDRCPLKGRAITFLRGRGPEIDPTQCTGCGMCLYFCPAEGAILIEGRD